MKMKTLVLVIIFSILIGGLIFWFSQNFSFFSRTTPSWKAAISPISQITQNFQSNPTSLPSPTPFVNSTTNLEDATKSLAPKDFSPDFQKLKNEVNSF